MLMFEVLILLLFFYLVYLFFFFKQKTAYEMRISDWSSDVCSSDLIDEEDAGARVLHGDAEHEKAEDEQRQRLERGAQQALDAHHVEAGGGPDEIGRASCRERVCQYV